MYLKKHVHIADIKRSAERMDKMKYFDQVCDWIFTFGAGQPNEGHYVKIRGTYNSAREKMVSKYGLNWSFQYSEEQWKEWLDTVPSYINVETEVPF